MKTRYGSEYNWFKVVGGLTVSISIEKAFFSENISQLMRNTPHARCSSTVVSLFLNVIVLLFRIKIKLSLGIIL